MSIKIKQYKNIHPSLDKTTERKWTKEDELTSLILHKSDVQKGCAFIASKIIEAGINHDHSKIALADMVEEPQPKDYKESEWYKAHIAAERHHLSARCPDDVNLIDVIEMIVDCTMAAMARKGHMVHYPIDNEILQKAYKNTVEMLKNEVIFH